jgi:glycosyltransferase involved in cell wall biosynthesis
VKNLIVIQVVAPDYRKKFFEHLQQNLGNSFRLYSGDVDFQKSIKSDHKILKAKIINKFLFKRSLLFQFGSHWRELYKKNIVVIGLNPRIISNWIFLILRKPMGLKTYVWGHAWPRKGSNSKTASIRHLMQLFASGTITYTEAHKKEMLVKHPKLRIFSAPNALYSQNEMGGFEHPMDEVKNVIYVGRLVAAKKPLFLVKAFHKLLDLDTNLIIVGDGPERKKIDEYIETYNLESRIQLMGHINDFNKLKQLYATSLVSVSPGYVGLSITQSFAFGVPMLISRNENHSPEIEVAKENSNAIFFQTDNQNDFCLKVEEVFKFKKALFKKRKTIANECKKHYTVEQMATSFFQILEEN